MPEVRAAVADRGPEHAAGAGVRRRARPRRATSVIAAVVPRGAAGGRRAVVGAAAQRGCSRRCSPRTRTFAEKRRRSRRSGGRRCGCSPAGDGMRCCPPSCRLGGGGGVLVDHRRAARWLRKRDGDDRPIGPAAGADPRGAGAAAVATPAARRSPASSRSPAPLAALRLAAPAPRTRSSGRGGRAADHRRRSCGSCSPSWTRLPRRCRRPPAAVAAGGGHRRRRRPAGHRHRRASWRGSAARGCRDHRPDAACGCPVLGRAAGGGPVHRLARRRSVPEARGTGPAGTPAARSRPGGPIADHVVPYDCGGRTGCENLCCLCRTTTG